MRARGEGCETHGYCVRHMLENMSGTVVSFVEVNGTVFASWIRRGHTLVTSEELQNERFKKHLNYTSLKKMP